MDKEGHAFNVNAALAILVVVAGVFLVSNQLSSRRPTAVPGRALQSIGEQSVDTRLWEDPFGAFEKDGQQIGNLGEQFNRLRRDLGRRFDANPEVQLLPILIPGGPYAEDRESRVRSRFAIVSALGAAGYAPEDAEHLGVAALPWPVSTEFTAATNLATSTNATGVINTLVSRLAVTTNLVRDPNAIAATTGLQFRLAFEWFRHRTFAPASSNRPASVLAVWLDDDLIQDFPLERLSLFHRELTDGRPVQSTVIGPRRSSTLRAMLPPLFAAPKPLWTNNTQLNNEVQTNLGLQTLYSTTASVMDEVLVQPLTNQNPRQTVRSYLQARGLRDYHNFTCTDAQIASSALDELELRGIDLTQPDQHLVLIGEWDTFYGRVVSLAYAAELSRRQEMKRGGKEDPRYNEKFVQRYHDGTQRFPTNLLVFNFLRGLDGQTFSQSGPELRPDRASRRGLRDVSELASWVPDENRAESSAQLDYLSRLGERLAELEQRLPRQSGRQAIRAIGIVGSDTYDTLLILQALRKKFPSTVFFTTDLDARVWHPQEFEWTRGLIIVNSFGLTLADDIQKGTAPFRDATQTAQYLGTLAALGVGPTNLLTDLAPRRFEVARGQATEISVQSAGRIHPKIRSEAIPFTPWWEPGSFLLAGVLLLFLLHRPLRNLLLARSLTKLCWLQDEDLGSVALFLQRLKNSSDPLAQWLNHEWIAWQKSTGRNLVDLKLEPNLQELPASPDAARDRRQGEDNVVRVRRAVLDFLNERIDALWWAPIDALQQTRLLPEYRKVHFTRWRAALRRPFHLIKNRCEIDLLLDRLELGMEPTERDFGNWPTLRRRADPLAQWFERVASTHPGSFPEQACLAFNERLAQYPWAPPSVIRESALLSAQTKANHMWYVRLLRAVRILTRPTALANREEMDEFLGRLFDQPRENLDGDEKTGVSCLAASAASARKGSARIYRITACRIVAILGGLIVLALCAFRMTHQAWTETCSIATGEPFSLSSGISAWPTEFLRLIAIAMAYCFLIDSYCSIRIGIYQVSRRFRLAIAEDSPRWFLFFSQGPFPKARTDAAALWTKYQQMGGFWKRFRRASALALLYFAAGWAMLFIEGIPNAPIRGQFLLAWDRPLLMVAIVLFLLLAFWTMDASLLCRWFIERLSRAPTAYPRATVRHFRSENGQIEEDLLDDWVDTELVADLTERVGRLVYYPAIIFFLMLVSRNRWWDAWPWPKALVAIFATNLLLAAASVLILQKSAVGARRQSIESLERKLKGRRLEIEAAPQASFHLGEQLLDELKTLRRGAFAPFWENPAIGALLVPSGGIAMIELLLRFWTQ